MKKITVFLGAATKMHTHAAVGRFLDELRSWNDVECESLVLSNFRLGTCRGCQLCFARGEEHCPMKDDRDLLIGKMMASDGVVFATPNYSFQLSALMKLFLDRLGFMFHRPRFFGKTFTSITSQGIYGGKKIERYLNFVGMGLGFNTVKGAYFTAFEPMAESEQRVVDETLAQQSLEFHKTLMKPSFPAPSLFMLMAFRMPRTSMKLELDERSFDYRYYRDKGWLESEYFYPVRLGPVKKLMGKVFDSIQAKRTGKILRTKPRSDSEMKMEVQS